MAGLLCNRFTYRPSSGPVYTPARYGMAVYEDVWVSVPGEGLSLHAYWIPAAAEGARTLVYFHGMTGNMGHRLGLVAKLRAALRCNVFIFSYRGFGRSGGAPSERGIERDCEVGAGAGADCGRRSSAT